MRGYDVSNITFIEGDTGSNVIDPLTTTETSAAALELLNTTVGERPVVGLIYTHSHADHFVGACGVTNDEDLATGRVPVLAPEGLLDAVFLYSEEIFPGVQHQSATHLLRMASPFRPPRESRLQAAKVRHEHSRG